MNAAPSQTPEAAGLEVVRWIVEARYFCPPGYKSGGGVSGIRDSRTGAETWAERLRTYEGTESVTITPLVTAASAQAAIDAEKAKVAELIAERSRRSVAWQRSEARADRLAKGLIAAEKTFEEIRLILIRHLEEPEREAFWKAVAGRADAQSALQQETQP